MIHVCNAPTVARQDYELASMKFTPALRVATALLPPILALGWHVPSATAASDPADPEARISIPHTRQGATR
jgi:hypothetical protein